eukprot:TRINITY_DN12457_c0_g1_i1.p1 TRINITY_DN12457_c0_g1~~TRINITY_DN12457_c0_g1_i1.p1  ORF type:complete len:165 (+),score=30.15 TRINITY_DN12457_c0_g1_i1:44-538(+)
MIVDKTISMDKQFRQCISVGCIDSLNHLIKQGSNTSQVWGDKEIRQGNALIWATFLNQSSLVDILAPIINTNLYEKQMLRSALHIAALKGNIKSIAILLKNGADINQLDVNDETPLHLASFKGHFHAILYLIKSGSNQSIKNLDNESPIDIARKYAPNCICLFN